jgi:hypothetical protein
MLALDADTAGKTRNVVMNGLGAVLTLLGILFLVIQIGNCATEVNAGGILNAKILLPAALIVIGLLSILSSTGSKK